MAGPARSASSATRRRAHPGHSGRLRRRRRLARSRETGALAVVVALLAATLFTTAALAVDIGNVWARRGALQVQADSAALFAAGSLPAVSTASRLLAAEDVAYYFACHPVTGQDELDPSIPQCDGATAPTSSAIIGYAQSLLDAGTVSFPTSSQVEVVTPPAKVDFGFSSVRGYNSSVQTKTATAEVDSPGTLMPIGVSLNCMLTAAHNTSPEGDVLSGVVPMDYITPQALTASRTSTTGADDPTVTVWPPAYSTDGSRATIDSVTPSTAQRGDPTRIDVTGSNWDGVPGVTIPVGATGTITGVSLLFLHGTGTPTEVNATVSADETAHAPVPDSVMSTPGIWHVKARVFLDVTVPGQQKKTTTATYTRNDATLTITDTVTTTTPPNLGCGRLLQSPRAGDAGPDSLQQNLRSGLDHELTRNPTLLQLSTSQIQGEVNLSSMTALLGGATGLFSCPSGLVQDSAGDVSDIPGTAATPNCVVIAPAGSQTTDDFTQGMLGEGDGHLACTDTSACNNGTFSLAGLPGSFNDDTFDDYVTNPGSLTSDMFFNMATYLADWSPATVTSTNAFSPDLYTSSRFFWVALLSAPLDPSAGTAYPILTFIPVFVTQNQPAGTNGVDLVLAQVSSAIQDLLASALGLTANPDDHGMVMNSAQDALQAMRFMPIEPGALPQVPDDYSGPVSPFLGIGPKVVRLVA